MRDFLYARCKEDKVLDVKATLVVRNQFWVAKSGHCVSDL